MLLMKFIGTHTPHVCVHERTMNEEREGKGDRQDWEGARKCNQVTTIKIYYICIENYYNEHIIMNY